MARTKKTWYDTEKFMLKHPARPNESLNIMDLTRHICTKTDMDAIAKEACEFGVREGENPKKGASSYNYRIPANTTPNQAAHRLWFNTDKTEGRHKMNGRGVKGSLRIQYSKDAQHKSARASPSHGITMSVCGDKAGATGRAIKVLLHEMIHVFQLSAYKEHTGRNGKRRPHDLMFNRMMLKLMQPWFNLTEKECNPFNMDYAGNKGYGPSRKVQRIIERKLLAGDKLGLDIFFKADGSSPTTKAQGVKPFANVPVPVEPLIEVVVKELTWDDISTLDLMRVITAKTRKRFDPRCSMDYLLLHAKGLKLTPADCVSDTPQTKEMKQ